MNILIAFIVLVGLWLVSLFTTGKTLGRYSKVTYNGVVITTTIHKITAKVGAKAVDLTVLSSNTMENLFGLPDPNVTITCPLDNTASTGSWTVFTAPAVFGNQTGAPLLIDYGIRGVAATGDPRISLTLMSVENIDFNTDGPNGAPQMVVLLKPCIGNALSFTTAP